MKKIILQILAVLLLLSLTLPAMAATAQSSGSADRAVPGGSVTIRFSLPERYENITAGGVSFSFDEGVFELTDAKWLVGGTLLKDVDTANRRGVFQFNSAKAVEGEMLELTFRISESARSASYAFEAEFQFAVSGQSEKVYSNPALMIYVYGASFDEDVDATTAEFIRKANEFSSMQVGEENYEALIEALETYDNLDEDEKNEVSATYGELIAKVEGYNAMVSVANEDAKEATSVAFSAMTGVFSFLSELFELLKTQLALFN